MDFILARCLKPSTRNGVDWGPPLLQSEREKSKQECESKRMFCLIETEYDNTFEKCQSDETFIKRHKTTKADGTNLLNKKLPFAFEIDFTQNFGFVPMHFNYVNWCFKGLVIPFIRTGTRQEMCKVSIFFVKFTLNT